MLQLSTRYLSMLPAWNRWVEGQGMQMKRDIWVSVTSEFWTQVMKSLSELT